MSDGSDPRHFASLYNITWVRVLTGHSRTCNHQWETYAKYRETDKCSLCEGLRYWEMDRYFNSKTMEKIDEL